MLKKLSLIVLTAVTTEFVRRVVERAVQRADERKHLAHKAAQKREVARWEDEGGAVVTPALPVPTQSAQAQANAPRSPASPTQSMPAAAL